jgi:hypothetical protein
VDQLVGRGVVPADSRGHPQPRLTDGVCHWPPIRLDSRTYHPLFVCSLAVLAAEFTDGWNIIVSATAGVLGAAVGAGAIAWATTRAESRRLREARSARLYDTRAATYRTLAQQIEAYRDAVIGAHLTRSPAAPDDGSSTEAMIKVLVADRLLRGTLIEVRLVASRPVREKAMALRDALVDELNAVDRFERIEDDRLGQALQTFGEAMANSRDRIEASQENLLDAISHELDLEP